MMMQVSVPLIFRQSVYGVTIYMYKFHRKYAHLVHLSLIVVCTYYCFSSAAVAARRPDVAQAELQWYYDESHSSNALNASFSLSTIFW